MTGASFKSPGGRSLAAHPAGHLFVEDQASDLRDWFLPLGAPLAFYPKAALNTDQASHGPLRLFAAVSSSGGFSVGE